MKYRIGDIVRLVDEGDHFENLFIVTDVIDYTEPNSKKDIDYETIQIYPVTLQSVYYTFHQEHLVVHAERDTSDARRLVEFILKDREKNGFYGLPDFLIVVRNNLLQLNEAEPVQAVVKSETAPMTVSDRIRYKFLQSIDACLDAINDLNTLIEMFPDDEEDTQTRKEYIHSKAMVEERLKRIVKK